MPPSYNRDPSTKRALLIGISYKYFEGMGNWDFSPTSIPNVKKIATFLSERCGYTDMIVMTDDDGVEEKYQPTDINLKREIKALCHRVQPGDRRFFYFAGYSDQIACLTGSEEDGMDKVLVAANGLRMRALYNWLVKPLPGGSHLTAIFDSCASGTLLDLDHYKCNSVYRPWVDKGAWLERNIPQNHVVRKNRKDSDSDPSSRRRSTFWKGSGDRHHGERCASPEREPQCSGWCRNETPMMTLDHPDVISISFPDGGQISWDATASSGDRISTTSFLIKILEKYPQITLKELMIRLNHWVHRFSVNRETRARREVDRRCADSESAEWEPKGEMDNLTDIRLGSITPLNMDRLFEL